MSRGEHERFFRLHNAFCAGDFAALKAELGGTEGFPNVEPEPGLGLPLTYAIFHGPIALVRSLLEAGADPNLHENDGFPPMIAAISTAREIPGAKRRSDVPELLELLLSHGADVGQRGINDFTPLHSAAELGDLALVDLLLRHGADPDEITRIDDMETAVEVATKARQMAVVERLAPLTTRLDWEAASKAGDIRGLARLISKGHDLNALDGFGQTALMRAAHAGRTDAVEWLIEQGADLDHSSKYHLTALMLAVIGGHAATARVLLRAGADTSTKATGAPGFAGKTAAELAEDRGDRHLAAELRGTGIRH